MNSPSLANLPYFPSLAMLRSRCDPAAVWAECNWKCVRMPKNWNILARLIQSQYLSPFFVNRGGQQTTVSAQENTLPECLKKSFRRTEAEAVRRPGCRGHPPAIKAPKAVYIGRVLCGGKPGGSGRVAVDGED